MTPGKHPQARSAIARPAQEEPQWQRLAQLLHDGLGQQLTGVALLAKALEQRLADRALPEAAAAAQLVAMVNQAVDHVRQLSQFLALAPLQQGDLPAALAALAASLHGLFGINCAAHSVPGMQPVPAEAARSLYRLAQEAAVSLAGSKQACGVTLGLAPHRAGLRLTVDASGEGAPAVLSRLRLRARCLGARLTVRRRPHGLRLVCTLPLPGARSDHAR
ncbi:MAG: hypothetical protein KatS3mg131_3875 [Candidatus Tectimicrobiota bacterium]|nr:MAG: hypothetical protein KatS3mg131_3875 [Candidatus Tectomicrobia bacterium]